MRLSPPLTTVAAVLVLAACSTLRAETQWLETPLKQSAATKGDVSSRLSLRSASRNDRWLGLEPREVRWAPDGSVVYFRWNARPGSDDVPEADPWYRVERDGRRAARVSDPGEIRRIPAEDIAWDRANSMAAWGRESTLVVWDGEKTRVAVSLDEDIRAVRFHAPGQVHFEAGEALLEYSLADGTLERHARQRWRPPTGTSPLRNRFRFRRRIAWITSCSRRMAVS